MKKREREKILAEIKTDEEIRNSEISVHKEGLAKEIKEVWSSEIDNYFGIEDEKLKDPEYLEYLRLKEKFGK